MFLLQTTPNCFQQGTESAAAVSFCLKKKKKKKKIWWSAAGGSCWHLTSWHCRAKLYLNPPSGVIVTGKVADPFLKRTLCKCWSLVLASRTLITVRAPVILCCHLRTPDLGRLLNLGGDERLDVWRGGSLILGRHAAERAFVRSLGTRQRVTDINQQNLCGLCPHFDVCFQPLL